MKEKHSVLYFRNARLALLGMAFLVFCSSVFCEERNALLIANDSYPFGNLANPAREARDLRKSLERLGFYVTLVENADIDAMETAIYRFGSLLKSKSGIGFFHYGGHAVQLGGKNYLIPANTEMASEAQIRRLSLDLDELMENMQGGANIVILDSCRDNPFPASTRSAATRGLALSQVKPQNSIVVYSADAGQKAQDGVFTPILTKKLLEPKSLHEILLEVRREVYYRTDGTQRPKNDDGLLDSIYLAGGQASPTYEPIAQSPVKNADSVQESAAATNSFVAESIPKTLGLGQKSNYDEQYEMLAALDPGGDFLSEVSKVFLLAQLKAGSSFYKVQFQPWGGNGVTGTAALFLDWAPAYNLGERVLGVKNDCCGFVIGRFKSSKDKFLPLDIVDAAESKGWKIKKPVGFEAYLEEAEFHFKSQDTFRRYLNDWEKASDDIAAIFKAAK